MKRVPISAVKFAAFAALMLVADLAFAGRSVPLPEPGMFDLLAIGAGAFWVIKLKNRNKK